MKKEIRVFEGDALQIDIPIIRVCDPLCYLYGFDCDGHNVKIPLDEQLLSQNIMIIGSIGTGKTNAFNQIIHQINERMTDDDVMIILDTKGDYYRTFYNEGRDVVISNDNTACGINGVDFWNIFNELDENHSLESVLEITKSIFSERIEKTSQVFFPNAAKDLLSALILYLWRNKTNPTNEDLLKEITQLSPQRMLDILLQLPEMTSLRAYIDAKAGAQQMGVLSELQSTVRELLIGNFAKAGTLSMKELVEEKKRRKIFIEYDLSIGQALIPIYKLLFDLAIKEALGRKKTEGNVWFIADEFRLLPKLTHIDDAVNFGRSLGLKMIIGCQNIEQIYNAYGEALARSTISGFMTKMIFYLSDPTSKQYVIDLMGPNRKLETYVSSVCQNGVREETRDANVVESWNISNLKRGEAIIAFPYYEPFVFKFLKYSK